MNQNQFQFVTNVEELEQRLAPAVDITPPPGGAIFLGNGNSPVAVTLDAGALFTPGVPTVPLPNEALSSLVSNHNETLVRDPSGCSGNRYVAERM